MTPEGPIIGFQRIEAERGLIAINCLGRSDPLAYYYGSLVYSNLIRKRQRYRRYGEGMMDVAVSDFRK